MRLSRTADLWWKNAVVYCLDAETYQDGDGDGCGDFHGLTQRIDHLHRLGVTCIWLMPFYPTPDRDDGYDITDFYGVDPRLGTHGDLVEFLRTARDRGIRVIADLVVNHTSDRHPWFQDARGSRDARHRDWYVWADEPPADGPKGVVFPDKEKGLWTYDRRTRQYYLHRFYRHQPDLNIANPEVRDEIARIMGFWMELGLSGFRVDAVPFMLETAGQADAARLPDPHDYLADLRSFLDRRDGQAVLLGEVNLPYKDTMAFYGEEASELTMCFDFIGMQQMYLALARGDARPLVDALRARPLPPPDGHWATFVRNHDELTLDKLSDAERQEVFDAFGPDKGMQLYDRGLRRRLPPMLNGDLPRIKLVYSLMFSLPGTPVLFYGEEIGMGENLEEEGRNAVRTPMQWRPGPGAGFSTADPSRFPAQLVEGEYGPDRVNVASQRRDPASLLSWIQLLIGRYRETPEMAWGDFALLESGSDAVMAHCYTIDGGTIVAVHNLGDTETGVELHLEGLDDSCVLSDLLVDGDTAVSAEGRVTLHLPAYGCRWLRAVRPDETPV
ncbi:alpha-amylase family protein [Actinomadura macrotermitis]|uniref:Alpha-amylase n=1 Tax=Actinomadura macrotermitis TaxID=2585200 RepID=A0A7K0BUL7_9ACTN|nr:alpha-amylase family protein [Actinomadura macrotermitis]MQY04900.1 Trehalose synthase/amylase TreS [Actinomadura macrotermitis]